MKIGINSAYKIKQIRDITDPTLTVIELDETTPEYPFKGWSDTRILCYCYKDIGQGIEIYPYIDTNVIEKLEVENEKLLKQQADIDYLAIITGVDLNV